MVVHSNFESWFSVFCHAFTYFVVRLTTCAVLCCSDKIPNRESNDMFPEDIVHL